MLMLLIVLIPLLRISAAGSAFAWSRAWNDETVLYANTLKTFPDAYTAKANLARCLPIPAELAYAEQLAREAVETAPWYKHGRYVLISIYLKTERLEAAMEETETILAESPTQLYPWSVMGYLKENLVGDRNAAIEAYAMAQRLSWQAESESATINHARLLSMDGKDEEALEILRGARERVPRARGLQVVLAEFRRNPDLFRASAQ
jgi:tetratricopeptide (TPR) repeat protein